YCVGYTVGPMSTGMPTGIAREGGGKAARALLRRRCCCEAGHTEVAASGSPMASRSTGSSRTVGAERPAPTPGPPGLTPLRLPGRRGAGLEGLGQRLPHRLRVLGVGEHGHLVPALEAG